MKENSNVDELLNSFIDGELPQRQLTEVQRLIENDEEVAQRLSELQSCKSLVGSLPCDEAPAEMAGEIKSALERRVLLGQNLERYEERRGARHLMFRKMLSAAAMLGLVAVLGAVIYSILAPGTVSQRPIAGRGFNDTTRETGFEKAMPTLVKNVGVETSESAIVSAVEKKIIVERQVPLPAVQKAREFIGRLELKTGGSVAVAAFINRTIEDAGLFEEEIAGYQSNKNRHALNCSREAMGLLLADLGNVWGKLDSAKLFVETDQSGAEVVIDGVTVEQISEITNMDGFEKQMKIAREFAVLNRMNELLPAKKVFAAIDTNKDDLMSIPKPVLTSSERTLKKTRTKVEEGQGLQLTIVVVDGK